MHTGNDVFLHVVIVYRILKIIYEMCITLQYGIKKKEPEEPLLQLDAEGRIGRKKKTPAEIAAENNPEEDDDDEFTSKFSSLCCCMNFV